MEYIWNEKKLKGLLKKDKVLISKEYSDELQLEINSLRIALHMPVLTKIVASNENEISVVTSSAANYIFQGKSNKLDELYPIKKLNSNEIISKAKKTMDYKKRRCLNKIIKKERFNFGTGKPNTLYLPHQHSALINVQERGILSDARNIVHEVAHVMYFNELKYEELNNVSTSYLKEVISIFNEMLFIDRLNKHKDIVNEQNIFLNNYYDWYSKEKSTDAYTQSFALAEYLFMLYKKERSKFDYQYNLFKEKLKSETDSNIITSLNIECTDLLAANEKYLNLYRK